MKPRISLLGAVGFLGKELASSLATAGYHVELLTRRPQRNRDLTVLPQLKIVNCDPFDRKQLTASLYRTDVLINLTNIHREHQINDFRKYHVLLSRLAIESAKTAQVKRYLHLSSLNADSASTNPYLRSKGEGESLVHNLSGSSVEVTSFRPSILFGRGDEFLRNLQRLLNQAPGVIPLVQADARLRPVYVGDVVKAITTAIEDAASFNRHIDLEGPQSYRLRELFEYVAATSGESARVVSVPKGLSPITKVMRTRLDGMDFLGEEDQRHGGSGRKHAACPTALESIAPLVLGPSVRR